MPNKPNILFIMADQLRADFLGCYGAEFIDTPNIDALAREGVRFENCYSEHPVCVPARVSLLTGMNAVRTGVLDNRSFLRPDYAECGLATWPELLKRINYRTASIGKMHFYPWNNRLGFEERIIAEDKCWGFIEDDYHTFLADRGYSKRDVADVPDYHQNFGALVSPHPWDSSIDHFVGSETARWIDNYDRDCPFALMVGFPGPHNPYDPAEEFACFRTEDMPQPLSPIARDLEVMQGSGSRLATNFSGESWYKIKNDTQPTLENFLLWRAYYSGLVSQIDREVGSIMEALRRNNLLENTIVIFSSDHGDYLGDHGLTGKGSFYEAGCRVPMIVSHPGLTVGTCDDLVTLTDVTATILAFASCQRPDFMDSVPLPGLGLDGGTQRKFIMSILNSGWAIFDGEWKLCKYPGGSHLFNVREDPDELRNRVREVALRDTYDRLDQCLTAKMIELMYDTFFSQQIAYPGQGAYSSSLEFGRGEWQRKYPVPWDSWTQ